MEHASTFAGRDLGRSYQSGQFTLEPSDPLPWAHQATRFSIDVDSETVTETVNHPHLALLKLLRDCEFATAMDIGCGEGAEVRLMRHAGKVVTAVNFDPACSFEADYFGDFMAMPAVKVDAVWCSHVLEHVRNPGAFLDRIYDSLNDGGWLALSVPYHEFGGPLDAINIGHHNRYNVLLLAYQLVCSGFDCSEEDFSSIVHGGQVSVVLRKRPNGIGRSNFAPYADVVRFMPVDGDFQACPAEINWAI
jgi:SAM-dependent methyltransferase